jgi:hypothetical protein
MFIRPMGSSIPLRQEGKESSQSLFYIIAHVIRSSAVLANTLYLENVKQRNPTELAPKTTNVPSDGYYIVGNVHIHSTAKIDAGSKV